MSALTLSTISYRSFGLRRLCIARLYGGGPPLFIDPAIIPTPSQPLTPSFPHLLPHSPVPPGHQPATPRFLLSLLAVSVYLSVPSLAAQALSSIINTIGPFTVIDYLRFAYGEGIGPLQEEDFDPLVGLEHVAQLVKDDPEDTMSTSRGASRLARDSDVQSLSQSLDEFSVADTASQSEPIRGRDLSVEKEDPAEVSSESGSPTSSLNEAESDRSFSYGAVSDKIGESCVSWLARWGADMLASEQQVTGTPKQFSPFTPTSTPPPVMCRRSTASTWRPSHPDVVSSPEVPLIWRRGGLTAAWVRALVSSDLLFVRGERERYDLARTVVELRRSEGILEEEEVEWSRMFTEGIYYANMVRAISPFVTTPWH